MSDIFERTCLIENKRKLKAQGYQANDILLFDTQGPSKAASIPGLLENMTDAVFQTLKKKDIKEMNLNVTDKNISKKMTAFMK